MSVWLLPGDCRDVLPTLPEDSVDACVTDPPYSLASIAKRFGGTSTEDDTITSAKARARAGPYARLAAGFMGQAWDTGEVAHDPLFWTEVRRVLAPGGHLVALGGTRTWHRLACAIEDSGFEVRDTLVWLYGTGWPKRPGLLKPAWEPIILAKKPGGAKVLNIGLCRVGTESTLRLNHAGTAGAGWRFGDKDHVNGSARGRWPANVLHDGSDEVLDLFPETVSGSRKAGYQPLGWYGNQRGRPAGLERPMPALTGSSGSAARFFTNIGANVPADNLTRCFYSAKAGPEDRLGSKHPTIKPVALIRWLMRLVTPPGGTVLDPFAGSGTAASAALAEGFDAILIERETEYLSDIKLRLAYHRGEAGHSGALKARRRAA
jgi:site-specific DNA-methyltransferase (adenine-specific)